MELIRSKVEGAIILSAGVIAIWVLAAAAVLISTPAEAARPSKAEKTALRQAIVACKAEAKGKKIKWLSRRKYVNNCVIEAMMTIPRSMSRLCSSIIRI
jgi:hypothetical protein